MTAKMSVNGGNYKLHREREIPADPKKECEIWHTIGAYLATLVPTNRHPDRSAQRGVEGPVLLSHRQDRVPRLRRLSGGSARDDVKMADGSFGLARHWRLETLLQQVPTYAS